jgi:hypothetical protein
MRLFAAITCLFLTCHAQSSWTGIDYYPGYNFFTVQQQSNELCDFTFPPAAQHAHYPAFLVMRSEWPMVLTDCVITCNVRLECSPDANFRYGGQGSWNNGQLPASARLFFSTVQGYSNTGPATNCWFNAVQYIKLDTNTDTATLIATLDNPAEWTDGQGQSPVDAFAYATANVHQIGLAFGGGNYYDVGIAMTSGTATFHLLDFEIQKQLRLTLGGHSFTVNPNMSQCFFRNGSNAVEWSTNLCEWKTL